MITKKVTPYIAHLSYVSDRIAYLDMKIPCKGGNPIHCRIVNIYSPTNTKSKMGIITKFYKELREANGPDGTPNELLKYAGSELHKARHINRCFAENIFLNSVGECFITPVLKPNNPPAHQKSSFPLSYSIMVHGNFCH